MAVVSVSKYREQWWEALLMSSMVFSPRCWNQTANGIAFNVSVVLIDFFTGKKGIGSLAHQAEMLWRHSVICDAAAELCLKREITVLHAVAHLCHEIQASQVEFYLCSLQLQDSKLLDAGPK